MQIRRSVSNSTRRPFRLACSTAESTDEGPKGYYTQKLQQDLLHEMCEDDLPVRKTTDDRHEQRSTDSGSEGMIYARGMHCKSGGCACFLYCGGIWRLRAINMNVRARIISGNEH